METVSCPVCGEKAFIVSVRDFGRGALQAKLVCTGCKEEIEWLIHRGTIQDLALKRFQENQLR